MFISYITSKEDAKYIYNTSNIDKILLGLATISTFILLTFHMSEFFVVFFFGICFSLYHWLNEIIYVRFSANTTIHSINSYLNWSFIIVADGMFIAGSLFFEEWEFSNISNKMWIITLLFSFIIGIYAYTENKWAIESKWKSTLEGDVEWILYIFLILPISFLYDTHQTEISLIFHLMNLIFITFFYSHRYITSKRNQQNATTTTFTNVGIKKGHVDNSSIIKHNTITNSLPDISSSSSFSSSSSSSDMKVPEIYLLTDLL